MRDNTEKLPLSVVTVSRATPVCVLSARTFAFGIPAPDGSVTIPTIWPSVVPCANNRLGRTQVNINAMHTRYTACSRFTSLTSGRELYNDQSECASTFALLH